MSLIVLDSSILLQIQKSVYFLLPSSVHCMNIQQYVYCSSVAFSDYDEYVLVIYCCGKNYCNTW